MDKNVISLTKLYYRKSLLSTIVANNTNVTDALKNLTIKDAVINLMTAWNQFDPQVIRKCWRNILVQYDDENVPLAILIPMGQYSPEPHIRIAWFFTYIGTPSKSYLLLFIVYVNV